MKKLGAIAVLAGSVCLLSGATFDNTQQKTFSLSGGGERRLILANIQGDIKVTGDSGSDIRLVLKEHWSADSQSDLDRARAEMKVEMVQTGNVVKISLESPSRNGRWDRHWDNDVRFRHDYEVQVPKDIALELKTVNGSEISVTNSSGDFLVRNVNGRISMNGMTGSGTVKTVNGKIIGVFNGNPAKGSSFETVNGTIDVTFQPGLNADLKLYTMHGDVYTDFDVQALASPVSVERSENGQRFRLDRNRKVRIGSGGIEHSFKTLNGTIKIRKSGGGK